MSPVGEVLAKLLLAVALIAGCIWAWNAHTDALIAKGDAAGYKRAQGEYAARELVAVKQAREEERAKAQAVEQELNHARTENAALRSSYDGAVAAGQRLSSALAEARAQAVRAARIAAATARGSAPADPAADLYADVQRRLDEATNRTIEFADESHIAGTVCERIYEAVRVKP